MVSLRGLDARPRSEVRDLPRVLLKAGACPWVPGKNSQEREGNPRVSVAGSSGLGGTFACEVTLVGRIIFLGLSFLFYTTKGVLTFSDLVEVLGGRNKLMFGRPV